jgi:hypothetical protein
MRSRNFRSKLAALAALVTLAALVGCGGSGAPEESATPSAEPETSAARVDVCGFLTSADIEEVLGTAPGEPQPGDEGLGECSWSAADGSGSLARLILDEATLTSFDDFVMEFGEEFGGENPPRERFHPVEGLGDWAMYVADDSAIRVFRGDKMLEVRSEAANGDEDTLEALAGKAVGHWE